MLDDEDILGAALERSRTLRRLPDASTRRVLRERAGIKQRTLARALGVDPATLCKWEAGVTNPSDRFVRAYLEALQRLAREAV
jgi:transcriptional regulator with XRE-family HTH domain